MVIASWREALPAVHSFSAASVTLLYLTQNQDSACPLRLPGLPQATVKDNHSFHGASAAIGEGAEYTQAADARDTM